METESGSREKDSSYPVSPWTDVLLLLQEDLGLSETTYELCYNAACSLIGQGQLTEALNKLQQAEGESGLLLVLFHYLPC